MASTGSATDSDVSSSTPSPVQGTQAQLSVPSTEPAPSVSAPAQVQPRDDGELDSARVQNPHEPEATYSVKGKGQQKQEHIGYKIQVAESVCEARLDRGEPTRNFIVGIVTHPAYEHDEAGALKMDQEQAQMGLDKPPVLYVDAAYVSAQKLVQAQTEGREIIGPALPGPRKEGRFNAADFQINVEQRAATCPAGKLNTQCSRLFEESTGKVSYRFEFSTQCHDCALRAQCLGKGQRHRSLVVGEHHTVLQTRRLEQKTTAFKQRMKHRNAIEGTQSELVRAHGLRRARYRGLVKVKLQNYFIGAACNVKRWIRRATWQLRQAALVRAAQLASTIVN
jgi:transposase